jgi:hypothetical protein
MSEVERLKKIIGELNASEKSFSISVGIKPQNITQFKNGERPIPSKLWVAVIRQFPQFNARWIITGEGDMYIQNGTTGSIIKSANRVSEPEINYGKVKELEDENSKLKNELLQCKDKIIEIQQKIIDN